MKIQYRPVIARFSCLLLFLILVISSGCKKDKKANEVNFKLADLTGQQAVPTNNSTATGKFERLVYNKDTKILTYQVAFSGLNPIGIDLGLGDPGATGTVIMSATPTTSGFISPFSWATPALTSDQEASLLSGKWYLNIRSNAYPDGEIRTQIVTN